MNIKSVENKRKRSLLTSRSFSCLLVMGGFMLSFTAGCSIMKTTMTTVSETFRKPFSGSDAPSGQTEPELTVERTSEPAPESGDNTADNTADNMADEGDGGWGSF